MKGIYSQNVLKSNVIQALGFQQISPHCCIKPDPFTQSQKNIRTRDNWEHSIFIRGDANPALFESFRSYILSKSPSPASLKGRWLIAIYGESLQHKKHTEIVLISDRVGSHRIYYTYDRGLLIWSTDLVELLDLKRRCAQVPKLDLSALNGYLHYLHQPRSKTMIQDVYILPPASMLLFSEGHPYTCPYWTPGFEPLIKSEKEAVNGIKGLLEKLPDTHISGTGTKTGLFLGGGLDSALLASLCKKKGMDLVTYHVGYENVSDERDAARAVAHHFKTHHSEILLKPEDVKDLLWEVTRCLGYPTGNPSSLAIYAVAWLAKDDVSRLMSGVGSDEIFAGHKKHIIARHWPIAAKFLSFMRKRFSPFAGKDTYHLLGRPRTIRHYLDLYTFFDQQQLNRLLLPEYRSMEDGFYASLQRYPFHKEQFLTDIYAWLADDLIPMATSLVTHHGLFLDLPFCDDDLLEYAAKIPLKMKVKGKKGKRVFIAAVKDWVPNFILNRKKQGFTLPMREWLRGPLKRLLDEYLHLDIIHKRGIFNPAEIQSMIWAHLHGKADLSVQLWGLISFEVWLRIFLDTQSQNN